MTTLDDLFTDRARAAAPGETSRDRSAQSLDRMFGQTARPAAAKPAVDDAPALRALVDAPARTFQVGKAPTPKTIRRVREPKDWMTIGLAVLAVVAVVVAALVVARSMAEASPAANALDTLSQTEAELVDTQSMINRDIALVQTDRDAGLASADALAAPLASFGDTVDENALATVEAARQAYVAAATALVVPEPLAPYRRGSIDQDSLASVGTAIDSANEQRLALDPIAEEVSAARTALTAADNTFAAALSAFTGSIPPYAQTLVDDNPDVDAEVSDAVIAAADALVAADLTTPPGLAAVTTYTEAVAAMREEQILWDEEAERIRNNTNNGAGGGGSSGSSGGGSTEGGSTGETDVQPPVVEPQPEPEPEPVPEPENPGTEPGTGG